MDLLYVCAGVTIKMLECYSSFEMSYSSENPGVLEYFGTEKKLNLAGLCSTDPTVPCPFCSLFLLCRLTDATSFPLKLLKALWTKESSSFLSTCEFALLGGNWTILYKCMTNFGPFFVTLLSRETTKEFLGHKKKKKLMSCCFLYFFPVYP